MISVSKNTDVADKRMKKRTIKNMEVYYDIFPYLFPSYKDMLEKIITATLCKIETIRENGLSDDDNWDWDDIDGAIEELTRDVMIYQEALDKTTEQEELGNSIEFRTAIGDGNLILNIAYLEKESDEEFQNRIEKEKEKEKKKLEIKKRKTELSLGRLENRFIPVNTRYIAACKKYDEQKSKVEKFIGKYGNDSSIVNRALPKLKEYEKDMKFFKREYDKVRKKMSECQEDLKQVNKELKT